MRDNVTPETRANTRFRDRTNGLGIKSERCLLTFRGVDEENIRRVFATFFFLVREVYAHTF